MPILKPVHAAQPPQQPEVIFLDAVGTLFGIRGSVGSIYAQFAAEAGVSVDPQALNQAFFQSFATAPKAAFPGAAAEQLAELEYRWWHDLAAHSFQKIGVLSQLGDFDAFFRPLFDYFLQPDPWVVYPDVLPTLAAWHRAGIRLGILSNFDSRLYPLLQVLDLAPWISSVTISTQVGAAKPDLGVFQAAIREQQALQPISEAQIAAGAIWHIGDSWAEDVLGAEAAGLQAVWLNRETAPQPAGGKRVIEVTQLSELP